MAPTGNVECSIGSDRWRFHLTGSFEDAVAYACDDVPAIVDAARTVLEREDLTLEQRQEIAETMSTRGVSFEVRSEVGINRK